MPMPPLLPASGRSDDAEQTPPPPPSSTVVWYLGGATAALTVALAPFLIVPWLPKRLYGALPYMHVPRQKLVTLFQMLPRHVQRAYPHTHTRPQQQQQQQQQQQRPRPLKFIDLGSGMGEAVLEARSKGFEARGVELNPTLYLLSSLNALFRVGPLAFVQQPPFSFGNMFCVNLREYDVIMVFGVQSLMGRLTQKIRAEAKHGAVVVLYRFCLEQPAAAAAGKKGARALEAGAAGLGDRGAGGQGLSVEIKLVEAADELSIYKVHRKE
jgi:hypothetical protein